LPRNARGLANFKKTLKESLNKSFDKLRTNGKRLIPLVVSLSNHERNQLVQGFLKVFHLSDGNELEWAAGTAKPY
jgi:hypothetical protein